MSYRVPFPCTSGIGNLLLRMKTREKEENEDTKKQKSHDHNNSENKDRLSDFPDSIVLHILSFLTAKEAVQTCILSTRWKYLWKHIPTLTLTSNDFKDLKGFTKFVTQILSLRDSSTGLDAFTFVVHDSKPNLFKSVVRYALSHHSLKKLSLDACSEQSSNHTVFPNNLNLPALTTLNLRLLAFRADESGRADPFSGFNRLNSLILDSCMILDGKTLYISNTTMIDLYLNPIPSMVGRGYPDPKIDLYAPKLSTFSFHGTPFPNLYGSNLSSLEHLNIDLYWIDDHHLILLNWLIELSHIKSLTISLSTLQVLFSGPHKLKVKLPFFCNLKILKVEIDPRWNSHVPDEMKDLLLQNAPLAEFCTEEVLSTEDLYI